MSLICHKRSLSKEGADGVDLSNRDREGAHRDNLNFQETFPWQLEINDLN